MLLQKLRSDACRFLVVNETKVVKPYETRELGAVYGLADLLQYVLVATSSGRQAQAKRLFRGDGNERNDFRDGIDLRDASGPS